MSEKNSSHLHKFSTEHFTKKYPELEVRQIDSPAPIGYLMQKDKMDAQIRQIKKDDAKAICDTIFREIK